MTVSQSKGNLNGCREQMKPGEEGIDGILEVLKAYVCDELCCHRGAVTQEEMDQHCCRCKLQQYTDKIREEYEKINAFDQSSTYQIMKKYRKIILCKDCRHRAKLRDDCYRCRKATSLLGTLEDYDGCSRGEGEAIRRASRMPTHVYNDYCLLNNIAGRLGLEVAVIREKKTGKEWPQRR